MSCGGKGSESFPAAPPVPNFIAPYPVSETMDPQGALQPNGSVMPAMGPDPTLFGALGSVADDDAELMRMMHNRAVGQAVQELGLSQEAAAQLMPMMPALQQDSSAAFAMAGLQGMGDPLGGGPLAAAAAAAAAAGFAAAGLPPMQGMPPPPGMMGAGPSDDGSSASTALVAADGVAEDGSLVQGEQSYTCTVCRKVRAPPATAAPERASAPAARPQRPDAPGAPGGRSPTHAPYHHSRSSSAR